MFGVCVANFENHCCVEGGDVSLKFGQWKERTIGIGGICRYVLLHYIMLKGMRKVTMVLIETTQLREILDRLDMNLQRKDNIKKSQLY